MDLAFQEKNYRPGELVIDLSSYEFTTLIGLQNKVVANITHLNISNNALKSLEVTRY